MLVCELIARLQQLPQMSHVKVVNPNPGWYSTSDDPSGVLILTEHSGGPYLPVKDLMQWTVISNHSQERSDERVL
jgi:hypothetical protein